MRCDWPVGFNEDCTDPSCEIYLQLFVENPDIDDDIVLEDDDMSPLIQLAPVIGDGDDFLLDYHVDEASSDLLSVNSDLSLHIVSVASDVSSESSDSEAEDLSGVEPQHEEISDSECIVSVISDSASEISVGEAETQEELIGAELHCKETSSKLSDEETSRDTWQDENYTVGGGFNEDDSDVYLELHCSPLTSPSPDEFDEASSNVPFQSTENRDAVPSLPSELPNEGELSQQLEPSSDNSSTGTHVSLFVVVPPTKFSNESSDNLLPAHPSDNLFSELLPIDAPCSSESLESGKENVQSNDNHEICTCIEEMIALSKMSACNTTSTQNDHQNRNNLLVPDLAAVNLDHQISHSITESNLDYEMDFSCSGSDSNESENTSLFLQNEACSEILTDKSVVNKKRKVSASSDDSVINKVPKYSSETSTDSGNAQETVENYCKVVTCNSDKQTSNDGDKPDILPPAVPGDNVILTLGKSVKESSVVNAKNKSR